MLGKLDSQMKRMHFFHIENERVEKDAFQIFFQFQETMSQIVSLPLIKKHEDCTKKIRDQSHYSYQCENTTNMLAKITAAHQNDTSCLRGLILRLYRVY